MFQSANVNARRFPFPLIALVLIASCGGSTEPTTRPVPASMQIVSGDPQTGVVGTELPQPLVVKVLDADGQPISGQLLNFRVTTGGGSVFAGSAITSNAGVAQERWTLGTTAGAPQTVEARAVDPETGAALVFATFHANAAADVASKLTVVSGDQQTGLPGATLHDSLLVRLTDKYDNAVQGATVTWAPAAQAGTVTPPMATTTGTGYASTRWTVGTIAGGVVVRASVAALPSLAAVDFHATVLPSTPVSVVIDSGLVASAVAGGRLEIVARVSDAFGNGVPGAIVSFTQGDGVRGVDTQPAGQYVTDATGRVRCSWGFGTLAGTATIRAWSGSVSSATGTVLVVAGPAAAVVKLAGDAQTANPGTAVAIAPLVKVTDQYGNPVSGAPVTFAVTSGGGSVGTGTATTDSTGRASAGSWTLGTSSGENTLTATVNGLTVTFTATARVQSPDVRVTITGPGDRAVVGDSLGVTVTVASTYQIASVRATIGDQQAAMTLASGVWTASLSLSTLPRDTASLIVRATDVNGAMTDAAVVVIHDRPPVISVAWPLRYAVARPSIDFGATCSDDDPAGCRNIAATLSCANYEYGCPYTDGSVLASGTTSLGVVSLAAYEGQRLDLNITATDSRGQSATYFGTIYVESSAKLTEAARVPGRVWDQRGGRTLYSEVLSSLDRCGDRTHYGSTGLRDATGSLQIVPFPQPVFPRRAVLTVTGVIASDALSTWYMATSSNSHVMEWRNGAVTVTTLTSYSAFDANDQFAAFASGGAPFSTAPILRRDISSGSDVQVASSEYVDGDSQGTYCNALRADATRQPTHRVARNGDVVYMASAGGLYRFRDGVATLITTNGSGARTDGVNVVFTRRSSSSLTFSTVLWDGAVETTLATETYAASFALLDGWTAFAKSDANGVLQAWTRSPAGVFQKLTSFGGTFVVEAVGPDGTVVGTVGNRRYMVSPAGVATEVGSALGTVLSYRDNGFFVLLGQMVLRMTP